MDMGIPALSAAMSYSSLLTDVSTSLLDQAMELQEQQAMQMIGQMLPPTGNILDTYA
jgi:hypothetical protein